MLYKLNNGVLITPPKTGYLTNGSSVTGYNKLPETILKSEGWKPLITDEIIEASEGYELVWCYEQDDFAIYNRCKLKKPSEVIEETTLFENIEKEVDDAE